MNRENLTNLFSMWARARVWDLFSKIMRFTLVRAFSTTVQREGTMVHAGQSRFKRDSKINSTGSPGDPGPTNAPGRYLARDGVRLCQLLTQGESDDVVARNVTARFEVAASDVGAIRRITEQQVCPRL